MGWEDFKSRSIGIWLFAAWVLVLLFAPPTINWTHLAINGALLAIQWMVLTIYIGFKHRWQKLPLFNYIGIGDLLMMVIVAWLFSPVVFQVILVLSLIVSLVYGIFKKTKTQPLAGIIALVTVITLWLQYWEVAPISTDQLLPI